MRVRIFILLILFLFQFIEAQNLPNDCQNYIQACDNQNVSYNVSGAGTQEIVPPSCSSQEHNSLWIRVTIDQPGTLGFTIAPQSSSINEDYDFWVFGPVTDCNNLGTPIRCSTTNPSAAGLTSNHTGLNATSSDLSEGPGPDGDSFVKELIALAGQSYFIVIDRPIGNSSFSLNWTGTATIMNPFSSINLPDFPVVSLCDEGNDNSEAFDFSTLDNSVLNGLSGFSISYHYSSQDASLNVNPIVGVTNIPAGTYYARIISTTIRCSEIKTVQVNFDALTTNDFQTDICENAATNSVIYDLSTHNNQIYTGTQQVTFKYFLNNSDATNNQNEITNWQNIVLPIGVNQFYVRTEKGSCLDISTLTINVYQRPQINSLVTLKQCDDDTDGFSPFNLNEADLLIVSNLSGLTISYFESLQDAQNNVNPIANSSAYINQTVNTQTLYYRVINSNNCSDTGQLNLIVSATQIPSTFTPIEVISCEDTFGTLEDGLAEFDFSSAQATIANLFTNQTVHVVFYETLADALAESNPISLTAATNYINQIAPHSQEIYVRVDSDLNNECVGLGKYVKLIVEANPVISPKTIRGCDDDHDGVVAFDTTTIEQELLNGLTNVTVSYTTQAGQNFTTLPHPFVTGSQTLTVHLVNNTIKGCSYSSTLDFVVDGKPVLQPIDSSLLTRCDDETDPLQQTGMVHFDTSSFESTIINGQTNLIVEYYDQNNNLLSSPLPNPFFTGTQNVSVKVMNIDNRDCYETLVLPFIVNPRAKIFVDGTTEYLCIDNPNDVQNLNAGLQDPSQSNQFTYQWFLNNQPITGANQYVFMATQTGNYSVDVFTNEGCVSRRNINIIPSEIGTITGVDIQDFSDPNRIEILVMGQGDYEYSLDGVNFQDSNVFYNVSFGIRTVFVNDKNGCGIDSREITVLLIPKFFTPNGDGSNDFWNVKGFENRFSENALISIYDRYGKLIKQIFSNSTGWDGCFNGEKLPATDYWYVIDMPDGRVLRGHFSLIR